ncbi:MAG: hypothetical protein P8Y29_00240, partial [Gemmatimonadota bacterium]
MWFFCEVSAVYILEPVGEVVEDRVADGGDRVPPFGRATRGDTLPWWLLIVLSMPAPIYWRG